MRDRLIRWLKVYVPILVLISYGATMVLVPMQYEQVGLAPTIFRFIAWQLVMVMYLLK